MKCALIGDPIVSSISHITHNYILSVLGYLPEFRKITTPKHQIQQRLRSLREVGYRYIAVTMPLKEVVIEHMHSLSPEAQASGAVNFIDLQQRIGYNTDGKGGIQALETVTSLEGKRLCMIGAGGTAKAQLVEAQKKGADVYLLCRNPLVRQSVCASLGCKPYQAHLAYDILIHATPVGMSTHSQKQWDFALPKVHKGVIALENIYHPVKTPFLSYVEEQGGTVIHGKEMFIHMAIAQFHHMLGGQCIPEDLVSAMRSIVSLTKN